MNKQKAVPLLDHAFVYNEILGLENGDDFGGKLCTDIHDGSNQNGISLDAKKKGKGNNKFEEWLCIRNPLD